MQNFWEKYLEEQNKLKPGSMPEDAATRMPPEIGQEFASRLPAESPYDVHVSDTTVPMAGKIEMPKNFTPGVPEAPRYEIEQDAAPVPPVEPVVDAAPDVAAKDERAKQEAAVLSADNDKAAREAGLADLEGRRKRNIVSELAAGAGDAISSAASAFGGNAPGGSQARLVERHDKDMEQGKKDVEQKLRNDANSDISKQYQQLLGQFLKKDPSDPTILGLTANQIAEKIPAVEKIASLRQQDDLTRLKLEENRLLKTQLAQDKKDKSSDELWTPMGQAKTKNDAKVVKDIYTSHEGATRNLDTLIALRKEKGAETMDRQAVQLAKTTAAELTAQYKDLYKLGVLSKDDYVLLGKVVPADPLQVDVLADTPAALEQARKLMDIRLNSYAKARGLTPIDEYQPQTGKPKSKASDGQRKTKSGISYSLE